MSIFILIRVGVVTHHVRLVPLVWLALRRDEGAIRLKLVWLLLRTHLGVHLRELGLPRGGLAVQVDVLLVLRRLGPALHDVVLLEALKVVHALPHHDLVEARGLPAFPLGHLRGLKQDFRLLDALAAVHVERPPELSAVACTPSPSGLDWHFAWSGLEDRLDGPEVFEVLVVLDAAGGVLEVAHEDRLQLVVVVLLVVLAFVAVLVVGVDQLVAGPAQARPGQAGLGPLGGQLSPEALRLPVIPSVVNFI